MGKAIRASVLILLLTCSAQAGYMPNGSPEPPPPSQPASAPQGGYMPNDSPTSSQPTGGEMTAGEMLNGTTDALTQFALDLLAVFPALL